MIGVAAPPEPRGWSGTLTYTGPDSRVLATAVVRVCAYCWGARRLLAQARNGEGLVPVTCWGCGGLGVVGGGA